MSPRDDDVGVIVGLLEEESTGFFEGGEWADGGDYRLEGVELCIVLVGEVGSRC